MCLKRCAGYVRARKELSIHEAPNILTIVLKRFQVSITFKDDSKYYSWVVVVFRKKIENTFKTLVYAGRKIRENKQMYKFS